MHGADERHRGRDDLVLYDGPLVVSLPNAKLRQLGQLDDNERASAISGEGGGGYSWDARVPSSCVLNVPRKFSVLIWSLRILPCSCGFWITSMECSTS